MAFRNRFAALAVILLVFVLFAISAVAGTQGAAAARYVVAQCGWHIGQDASWFDSSADKFRKNSYCQPPSSSGSLEGVHVMSEVRGSTKTVGGTRFASWRWQAPPGTGIVNVRGQRWQYVRNGFRHRLGGITPNGSFEAFLELDSSDGTKREFWRGFSPPAQAFESRLACRRPRDTTCKAEGTILTGLRALTISIEDSARPTAAVNGALSRFDWLRGTQSLGFDDRDVGSGLRFAETSIDGALRARSEMSCAAKVVSGEWRGTRMRPCPAAGTGVQTFDTRTLSDGAHLLRHCAIDFAGGTGCALDRTIRVDNNAPAAPRSLAVEGGDGWHRQNSFDLTWSVPAQGAAAPVGATLFRMFGPDGYSKGPWAMFGSGKAAVKVPGPGEYRLRVWLADLAHNSNEAHSAEVKLKLDDVPPSGYFVEPKQGDPTRIVVPVSDRHSGIAGGAISWRPESGGDWQALPTQYALGERALVTRLPADMRPGTWLLRAAIVDRAGNVAVTDRRANGSPMSVTKLKPVPPPKRASTLITAGLGKKTRGMRSRASIGYGERAYLRGRLTGIESTGIADAELLVTEIGFPGSRRRVTTRRARTDQRGFFGLWLARGPGRRVKVKFAGNGRLEGCESAALQLRVGGRVRFSVRPKRLKTGRRVRFRGRVSARGAWRPIRGDVIQIQYFEEAARKWRPVTVTRTDRRGRFRASYRFRYITGRARIRLRALLIPSPRFPYAKAASKPVVIRVRG